MMQRKYRFFACVAPLIALNWLLVALLERPSGRVGFPAAVWIGFVVGSLFSHAALAAGWAAFGPARLVWRLPLSLIWVVMMVVALAMNAHRGHGPDREVLFLVGPILLGQWLLVQLSLWGISLTLSLYLRHADEIAQGFDPRERQFGIGQILIITALVALLLGIGRMVIVPRTMDFDPDLSATVIWGFLGIASTLQTLPLLLAALLRRQAILAVVLTLTLVIVVTLCESPLLEVLAERRGPRTEDFIAINAFTAGLMLVVLTMVRMNGYSLTISRRRPMA